MNKVVHVGGTWLESKNFGSTFNTQVNNSESALPGYSARIKASPIKNALTPAPCICLTSLALSMPDSVMTSLSLGMAGSRSRVVCKLTSKVLRLRLLIPVEAFVVQGRLLILRHHELPPKHRVGSRSHTPLVLAFAITQVPRQLKGLHQHP